MRLPKQRAPEARAAKLEGSIIIEVIVDQEGHPATMTLLYSPPSFKDAVGASLVTNTIAAVKQWSFQPQILNGVAESYSLRVLANFELAGVSSAIIDPPAPAPLAAKAR
jgi:outer membrane biosynthesis protein TonB